MLATVFAIATFPAAAQIETLSFETRVRPILAEHCFECHGPDKSKGGLDLTSRESATKKLTSGAFAIDPAHPSDSAILHRIDHPDPEERMPPSGRKPLTAPDIEALKAWVRGGGVYTTHWAYLELAKAIPPRPIFISRPRNPIDTFILAQLEEAHLEPAEPAGRPILVRRLYSDLLGLPPDPGEVDAFVNDQGPDALERLVDRLLANPHFGERWGRHWLDAARYADSDGYEKDRARPDAWRYRDWVIQALNEDMPFDQFTVEQLAGDLLHNPTPNQLVGTAFHRQTLTNDEGGVDKEQYRVEAVFDRVETVGTVWLGLTVGCARCHSHKYDRFSQREYYQLFAFFNNADEVSRQVPRSAGAWDDYVRQHGGNATSLITLQWKLDEARARFAASRFAQWEEDIRAQSTALGTNSNSLAPESIRRILAEEPARRPVMETKELIEWAAQSEPEVKALAAQLEQLRKSLPSPPLMEVRVVSERCTVPRSTRILNRGDFLNPGAEVAAGTPAILNRDEGTPVKNRLDFGRWMVGRENPLTPRVIVNRVWLHLFGEGLVRTPNDFGVRGERPTHPELLEWLAVYFVENGWSLKSLIRRIVTSSTYLQSSRHRAESSEIDPQNRLLHRQNRPRIEAEIVRDYALAASGLLVESIGGPSVFPPMPREVAALSYADNFQWSTSRAGDRYRRGLYTFFKRTAPHPDLVVFDCPDANVATVRRNASNTPLQALTTLNAEAFSEAALALARRVLHECRDDDSARIARAFQLCLARQPTDREMASLADLLGESRRFYSNHSADAANFVGLNRIGNGDMQSTELAAWGATVRILLNLDEMITRN